MADTTFLQAFRVGQDLVADSFNRDLQRRQLAGQEADRALRARVSMQEMELNAIKIDELSTKIAQQAKLNAAKQIALSGWAREMNMPQFDPFPIKAPGPDLSADRAPMIDAPFQPRFPGDGIGVTQELLDSAPVAKPSPVAADPTSAAEAFVKHFAPIAAMEGTTIDDAFRGVMAAQKMKVDDALTRQKTEADIARIKSVTDLNKAREKQVEAGNTQKQPETLILLDAYDRAESEGDQNAMQAIGQKLKLAGLDEIDKELMRAEVSAAKNNVLLALDKEKLNAELAAIEKKYREKQGSKKSSTAPKMRWEAGKGLVK